MKKNRWLFAILLLATASTWGYLTPIGGGGGGAVSSVFTRTGAVTAQSGDYSSFYAVLANNLSDLTSAATARVNLGLGTIATFASSAYCAVAGCTMNGSLVLGNTNNARQFIFDYSVPNSILFGKTGTNYTLGFSDSTAGGSGVGWMAIGANGVPGLIGWPIELYTSTTDGNVTSLSALFPLGGASTYNNLPIDVFQNASSVANTIVCRGLSGSSNNLMAALCSRNRVQTNGSEVADAFIVANRSGTPTEQITFKSDGTVKYTVQAASTTPACAAGDAGSTTYTSAFVLCVCNGSGWVHASTGITACTF